MTFRDATFRSLLFAVFTLSASAQTVRIGVFTLFHPLQLEIEPAGSAALVITGGHAPLILNGERGHRRIIVHFAKGNLLIGDRSRTVHQSCRKRWQRG